MGEFDYISNMELYDRNKMTCNHYCWGAATAVSKITPRQDMCTVYIMSSTVVVPSNESFGIPKLKDVEHVDP